jgi:hypothetical protein
MTVFWDFCAVASGHVSRKTRWTNTEAVYQHVTKKQTCMNMNPMASNRYAIMKLYKEKAYQASNWSEECTCIWINETLKKNTMGSWKIYGMMVLHSSGRICGSHLQNKTLAHVCSCARTRMCTCSIDLDIVGSTGRRPVFKSSGVRLSHSIWCSSLLL